METTPSMHSKYAESRGAYHHERESLEYKRPKKAKVDPNFAKAISKYTKGQKVKKNTIVKTGNGDWI